MRAAAEWWGAQLAQILEGDDLRPELPARFREALLQAMYDYDVGDDEILLRTHDVPQGLIADVCAGMRVTLDDVLPPHTVMRVRPDGVEVARGVVASFARVWPEGE